MNNLLTLLFECHYYNFYYILPYYIAVNIFLQTMHFQEERYIRHGLRLNRFRLSFLRSLGLYPYSNGVSKVLKVTNNICSTIFMSMSFTFVLCQYVSLYSKGDLLVGLSNGASETVAYTAVLIKSIIFKCKIKHNVKMQNIVENSWRRVYLRGTNRKIYKIIRETEETIKRITYASCSTVLVTYLFLTATPVFADYTSGTPLGTELTTRVWLPFELSNRVRRVLAHVTHWFVIWYICSTVTAIFNLYMCILNLLSAQFEILKVDFMSFADDVRGVRISESNHETLVSFRFKMNIERHQKLLW